MRKTTIAALAAALSGAVLASPASAAPTRSYTVGTTTPASWTGPPATAANVLYDTETASTCGTGATRMCDKTLITAGSAGHMTVRAFNFSPLPLSDFDVYVYNAKAGGSRDTLITAAEGLAGDDFQGQFSPGRQPGGQPERVVFPVTGGARYLIEVVYRTSVGSSYDGAASLTTH